MFEEKPYTKKVLEEQHKNHPRIVNRKEIICENSKTRDWHCQCRENESNTIRINCKIIAIDMQQKCCDKRLVAFRKKIAENCNF